jgi:hypothetical protein
MYHTCELAKSKRRSKKSSLQTKTVERDGALKTVNIKAGARVSLHHFESRLLGRIYDSYGKTSSTKFKVGAIYVEHASGETIRGKQIFKKMCMDNRVVMQDYLADSGAFKANNCVYI